MPSLRSTLRSRLNSDALRSGVEARATLRLAAITAKLSFSTFFTRLAWPLPGLPHLLLYRRIWTRSAIHACKARSKKDGWQTRDNPKGKSNER